MSSNSLPKSWPPPSNQTLTGQWVSLVALNWDIHGKDLETHVTGPNTADLWTYMSMGPFENINDFRIKYDPARKENGWVTMAIINTETERALGIVSYMRIRPKYGSAEVGFVLYSKALQRTTRASEVIYLMGKYLFDTLGYRRFEWKCHNDNKASKRAALRYGFTYEGLFRKDMVSKGENRDTAWFSITDDEWPHIRNGFEKWLNIKNFDKAGQQIISLEDCREHHV